MVDGGAGEGEEAEVSERGGGGCSVEQNCSMLIYNYMNQNQELHIPDFACSMLDLTLVHNQDQLSGLLHPQFQPISGLDHQSTHALLAPKKGCSHAT